MNPGHVDPSEQLPDTPDEDAFRALARSSPWRFRTLRFTHAEHDPRRPEQSPDLRAWLRRPDGLRIERTDDGTLLTAGVEPVAETRASGWFGYSPGVERPSTDSTRDELPPTSLPPLDRAIPLLRPDGLVAVRPRHVADAPMWQSYLWVAMLDPVELADGGRDGATAPTVPGVRLTELTAGEVEGRPVWEAIAVATDDYAPRCPCCPLLLWSDAGDVETVAVGGVATEAHQVRLDVETGVCVGVRAIGGSLDGWRIDTVIEAVDEPMPDELFEEPRRRWWSRG